MKKIFTALILTCLFCVVCFFSLKKEKTYKVIKIVSMTEFYVDLNRNNVADNDELIQLFGLYSLPELPDKIEKAHLEYLGKVFAKQNLLNKKVLLISDINKDIKIILPDGAEYSDLLKKKGYVLTDKNKNEVLKNLEYAKTLNLVSYNKNSGKYHKLDCKYALTSSNEEIVKISDLGQNAAPCKLCFLSGKSSGTKTAQQLKYPKDVYEAYKPLYKDDNIEFFVTDYTKYYYPSNKCLTTLCKSLLNEINSAKQTIDFAIYGVDNQPEITKALINAQKRGVKIRWVYDTDKNGYTIYSETAKLNSVLKSGKRDIDVITEPPPNGKSVKDAIMHDKFFIFDNKKVWTGSANISHTDLSGFNANSAVLVKSNELASIYRHEFEQMYNGYFHRLKSTGTAQRSVSAGSTRIRAYFSPQDRTISKYILPLINSSQKYVYIPVFVLTHKDLNNALVSAHNRGVDVRIIVDATSAASKYSSVKYLRPLGIKVKAENRAGKMHMKSIIIDDKYVVLGSMNFTKSGENYNDENVLIIENPKLAKAFKEKFIYFYNNIPDKWLYKNPGAESFNSINSCFDGVDNDFDGKTDMQDESCNFKLRRK